MDLIAIAERHVDKWFAEHLVLLPLIRLAINKRIEFAHSFIHELCALPDQREIWVGCEMNASGVQLPKFPDCFGTEKLLLLSPKPGSAETRVHALGSND